MHVATAYFKVVKYLFAHTIQEGDPRARPTRCVVCPLPVRPVLYSTCTINARCEMRHSRHRQQGRSSMANPRGRACGSETNNQADDMMCTLLWWGRNTAAWRLMTRGRALILGDRPQPLAQICPDPWIHPASRAPPPFTRDPQPASPPNRSLHPHSPPTSSSSSFRWLPDLDALDGMSTRNSLACPTLAPHCLFVLAHGLHTDTRAVHAVLLRK